MRQRPPSTRLNVNPDETTWSRTPVERVRAERRRGPVNIDQVIPALRGDPGAFEVSAGLVPQGLGHPSDGAVRSSG